VVLACFVLTPSLCESTAQREQAGIIEIDGKKNPERVPEYRVWAATFRTFAGGVRMLPDRVREHVSTAEETMIFAEADHLQKVQADCVKRLVDAREPLAALERTGAGSKSRIAVAKEVDTVMWEIELGCRWETLHARDRVLERLNPNGRAALLAFVESRKAGLSFTVPKNGMDRFRQPQ
jgi:hypothetical protein